MSGAGEESDEPPNYYKVEVDAFYAALVLDLDKESTNALSDETPDEAQLEILREATNEYLYTKLSQENFYPTLARVDVKFEHLQYNSQKPQPKFQVYWEGSATFYFDARQKLPKDATPPRVFDAMGREFDQNKWLTAVLLPQFPPDSSTSPFKSAVEVQVRRLRNLKQGGAIQLPPFYFGFGCQPAPAKNLTSQEKSQFATYAQSKLFPLLQREWLSTFESFELQVTKTAINEEAYKPDDKYNLYIQLDANATFSKRPPEPNEIFRILTAIVGKEHARDFIGGVWDLGGNVFPTCMRQAIRVCAWIEDDDEDEDDEKADNIEDDKGDEQQEDGGDDGQDEILKEIDPPPGEVQKIHLEFNVACVVRDLEAMPNESQLRELDAMIKAYFGKRLTKVYKDLFVKFESFEAPEPKYNTGRPLPRFNMIHQYIAILVVKKKKSSPEPMEILNKLMSTKVLGLLNAIKLLNAPWNQTKEVTLGKGDYRKAPKDQIYGGTIDEDGTIRSKDGNMLGISRHSKRGPLTTKSIETVAANDAEDCSEAGDDFEEDYVEIEASQESEDFRVAPAVDLPQDVDADMSAETIEKKKLAPAPDVKDCGEAIDDFAENYPEVEASQGAEDSCVSPASDLSQDASSEMSQEATEKDEPALVLSKTEKLDDATQSKSEAPNVEMEPTVEETQHAARNQNAKTEEATKEESIDANTRAPEPSPPPVSDQEKVALAPISPKDSATKSDCSLSHTITEAATSGEADGEKLSPDLSDTAHSLPSKVDSEESRIEDDSNISQPESVATKPFDEPLISKSQSPAEEEGSSSRTSRDTIDHEKEDVNRRLKFISQQLPPLPVPEKEVVILKPIPPKSADPKDQSYLTHNINQTSKVEAAEEGQRFPKRYDGESLPHPQKGEAKESSAYDNVAAEEATRTISSDDREPFYDRPRKSLEEHPTKQKHKIRPGQGKEAQPKPKEREFNPEEIVQWEKPEEKLTELQLHMLKFKQKKEARQRQSATKAEKSLPS